MVGSRKRQLHNVVTLPDQVACRCHRIPANWSEYGKFRASKYRSLEEKL